MQKNSVFSLRQPMNCIFMLASITIVAGCIGCQGKISASRPLIGITSVYQVEKENDPDKTVVGFAYVEAVSDNGGIPVILPTVADIQIVERYIDLLDGLVLIGGDDVPPETYGQQPHETVKEIPKLRYDFERQLISMWLSEGKPILGICLGMQFTNVVSGGTLIQDIPSQVGTEVDHYKKYHRIRIEPDSTLAKILHAQEASVLSSHHQAVDTVGAKLRVTAQTEDGIIEAMERTEGDFGLFVQWHPEFMKDTLHRNAIYGALIRAAAKHRNPD